MDRLQEIEARKAEIRTMLEGGAADLDIDALTKEVDELEAEARAITEQVEKRAALVGRVVGADAKVIRTFPTSEKRTEETYGADSPEYRSAFLKNLAGGRLGEMTDTEKRAWTYLTTNTTAVLPTGIQLGIVDMIAEKYTLVGDLNPSSFSGAVEFQQATAIVSGAAGETNENTAASDNLRVTFVKVGMTGVEIRGSVKIGRKMQLQSVDGFETWLTTELSREMGAAMNAHAWDAVDDDMLDANQFETDALVKADFREAFGALKGAEGPRYVYANSYTIWNHIDAVEDDNGREYFTDSARTDDPTVQGRIKSAEVKLDDTLPNGVIYVGYPATIKANVFEAPNVLSDVDVETREVLYAGYALFEARLGDTRSWAKITVEEASA